MLTFFRRIRKGLLDGGRPSRYLLYAIGEILLVMIGILLALQVNSWKEERVDRKLERRYLTDLLYDLQKDSITLAEFANEANIVTRSKQLLLQVIEDPSHEMDSLWFHFTQQWNPYKVFAPITITIDEMRSSSNLDVIRNNDLKRDIVGLYNSYEVFRQDERLFHRSTRDFLELARQHLPYIGIRAEAEAKAILEIPIIANTIRTNFAGHHRDAVVATWLKCQNLIQNIRNYLNQL